MKFFHKLADWASYYFGTPQFLGIHILWWAYWFIFRPEPYPFNFLTMLLSLEAIVLAILILNSDTRQGHKDRKMVQKDLDIDTDTKEIVVRIWKKLNE